MKLSNFQINKIKLNSPEVKEEAVFSITFETSKYAYNLAKDINGKYYFRKNWNFLEIDKLTFHEKEAFNFLKQCFDTIEVFVYLVIEFAIANDRENYNKIWNKISERLEQFKY